jgi:hydroxymethylbilane synthase
MSKISLVVGTRGSELAFAQTQLAIDMLQDKCTTGATVEFSKKVIRTSGDEGSRGRRLPNTSGKDAFTRELDEALLKGEIDLAVHSLKDVPNYPKEKDKIELASFPARGSPFDALISRDGGKTLATLPEHATIGTSSARRMAQLKNFRPDFNIREIHGNVTTRISKLRRGEFGLDGIILAEAGLDRLHAEKEIDEVIPGEIILPAVGQGCLAISVRSSDRLTKDIVKKIDDEDTRRCVSAERVFSMELGGGCNLPIAALATSGEGTLTIEGMVAEGFLDNKIHEVSSLTGLARGKLTGAADQGEDLGRRLAQDLKKRIAGM